MSNQPTREASVLTRAQTPILIGQQLHPGVPLYNMAYAFVFESGLDHDAFVRAWQHVVDQSDALRTLVVGRARRILTDTAPPTARLERSEWSRQEFLEWCRERTAEPLDPATRMLDSVLVELDGGATGWYLNQHHLITDAWSTIELYRSVAATYERLSTASGEPETESRPSYYDTAPEPGSEAAADARRSIPLYGRAGQPMDTANQRVTLELTEAQSRQIDALCAEPGIASLSRDLSRFAVFSALYLAWLHRVSGERQIGFDTPVAARSGAAAKRALGLFIEVLPFAVELDSGDTLRSLVGKCLEESRQLLGRSGAGSAAPSLNVVLNFFPKAFGSFAGQTPSVDWVHPGHADDVHAVRLQVHDFGGTSRYVLHFDCNESVLPEEQRERAPQHFVRLLDAVLADPDRVLGSIDVLSTAEVEALAELNATGSEPAPAETVFDLFEQRVEAQPEGVAVQQGDDSLTFAELHRRVESAASALESHGVSEGARVAISTRRSIEAVIGVLAIMRLGAAYVPIDPGYPAERVRYMLDDCGAELLLVDSGDVAAAGTRAVVELGALLSDRGPAAARPQLSDVAYVKYTSGSTGRPKGVVIEHLGLADYVGWAARRYVRGDQLRFALFSSLSFDLTVTSLFLPLVTGGTMVVYPDLGESVDSALFDVLRDNRVDFIKLTPSQLKLLVQSGAERFGVRRMVVGGEDLTAKLAMSVYAQMDGRVEIHNEYGPTEAVVGCIAHRFDPDQDTSGSVPIGAPADHVEIDILDEHGVPVPAGVPGDLHVARLGLARGYLGQEERTRERFVTAPDRIGGRWYDTGDRVRLVRPGVLEYLGRADRQVKISGHRVELGEVEAALVTLDRVRETAVIARPRRRLKVTDQADARCIRCGLPSNHPKVEIGDDGVCSVCKSYEAIRERAAAYFRTMDDLAQLFADSRQKHQPQYDCMMLLSGGKDSTYALCQLVEMGLSVYAYTLDNGFIAEGAKENIRRATEQLGVPVEFGQTPAMDAIFRDSLNRFSNVCQGCFKTIYTLSTIRAKELGIPIIVTGLSRGQMFETRLTEEMFRDGDRTPDEVDAAVLAARKAYHRVPDAVSENLDVEIFKTDAIFDEVQFVDFYRFCNVGLEDLYGYLGKKIPWARPKDSGRSTNCLINDTGIYVHKRERGFHNYALPYSWDVRLGHKTRDEALDELDDDIDDRDVRRILNQIGLDPNSIASAHETHELVGYYVADSDLDGTQLREHLASQLPAAWIPSRYQRIDQLPLTSHGKLDEEALPMPDQSVATVRPYRAPEGPVQEFIADLWRTELGVDRVGADDDFFELGGTSLLGMEIMITLCREFALELPLETLFTHPTVYGLGRIAEDIILADDAG